MKFSVITPSYNQVQFLPDNLRTVSSQEGVELEHIIVDPGSTDGSTELAQKAIHATLINEPDRGQSHGITKGYSRATGDILVWLNSDDFYPDNRVLARVAAAFENNPNADIIYGNVNFVDEQGNFLRKGYVNKDSQDLLDSFQYQVGIVQPGVFMRRKVFEEVGGPSEDYNYCMDYEYWVRKTAAGFKWVFLDEILAHHRWWPGMKTSSGRGDSLIEHFKVCDTYFGYIHHKWLDRYGEFLAANSDGVVNHAQAVNQQIKNACVKRAIERFVTQDMLALLETATSKEQQDTLTYIRQMAPGFQRYKFNTDELSGAASTHPDTMANQRIAWHIFDTRTPDGRDFKTYTVPNNFSRSFDSSWYHYESERAKEKMTRLAARRKDKCVIVANGPSLNKSNLDLLSHADVIISNYAIISKQLMKHASILTVVNDLVAKQGSVRFNDLDIIKFFPFWLANSINATETTFFLPATVEPVFCTGISGTFSWRSTVSFFNMQLAFALGYECVTLIGFDHSYQQAVELKEGASITQKEEDPNHFDPRYFQGKTWQAADTANMEKMYLVARDAYQAAGRSIVNATIGGKLEIFPRCSLEEALGVPPGGLLLRQSAAVVSARVDAPKTADACPKLLILDMTAMGDSSATGALKSTLLADWPADRLLQIAKQGPHGLASVQRDTAKAQSVKPLDLAGARASIAEFAPDLILYRPVPDTELLHALALQEINARKLPLVIWIMDDWPARMEAETPDAWRKMKPDLEYLLRISALRLSISEAMSATFVRRYGVPFVPFANAVDPAEWPVIEKRSAKDGIFRLRFAGGLAPDMNRKSILQIAEAVERIGQSGIRISFQINTQQWWLEQTLALFKKFRHTQIQTITLKPSEYRKWLSEADSVVIAYNFDEVSRRYIQYSMANKMPECLASGSVLLAYGPRGVATIDYLETTEAALVVFEESVDALEVSLRMIIKDPTMIANYTRSAKALAFNKHNLLTTRQRFAAMLRNAVFSNTNKKNDLENLISKTMLSDYSSNEKLLIRVAAECLLNPSHILMKFDSDQAFKKMVDAALSDTAVDPTLYRHISACQKFALSHGTS